jgi:hypothetical protein
MKAKCFQSILRAGGLKTAASSQRAGDGMQDRRQEKAVRMNYHYQREGEDSAEWRRRFSFHGFMFGKRTSNIER